MLCQFTVKNYKSIRDEVTFDMQAAAISEHKDRIIKDVDGELYLPVSAIYGPNGGGKSNVLEASILESGNISEINQGIFRINKLTGNNLEPTALNVFLRVENEKIEYIHFRWNQRLNWNNQALEK